MDIYAQFVPESQRALWRRCRRDIFHACGDLRSVALEVPGGANTEHLNAIGRDCVFLIDYADLAKA